MKRILGFLASTSLLLSSTLPIVSCVMQSENLVQEQDKAVIARFKSEMRNVMKNYIEREAINLFDTKEDSISNQFFNFENIERLASRSTDVGRVNLTSDERKNLTNDLEAKMNISKNVGAQISQAVSRVPEYESLIEGITSVYDGFDVENKAFISHSIINEGDTGQSEVYSVSFRIWLSFKFLFEGSPRVFHTSMLNLYFNLAPKEIIVDSVKITEGLAQNVWMTSQELLKFNENSFDTTGNVFAEQSENVGRYFEQEDNQKSLKSSIESAINSISNNEPNIEYNLVVSTDEIMYDSANFQTSITSDGFIERELLLKKSRVTGTQKNKMFARDFSLHTLENFFSQKRTIINQNYRVNLFDSNSNQLSDLFIEFGRINLDKIILDFNGLKINLNRIRLLYTYNPTVRLENEISKTLEQWQKSWNVSASKDPGALWRMHEVSGTNASAVWNEMSKNPNNFIVDLDKKYYNEALEGTVFENFKISFESNLEPNATVNNNGFSVDYSSHSNFPSDYELINDSWRLVIEFDNIVWDILFATNSNYWKNVWFGSSISKLLIERT